MISALMSKVLIPPGRNETVPREHLLRQLNRVEHYRCLLLSTPAGFGKTTLLTQWVQQYQGKVAWLSLSSDDSDPNRFWFYVINALEGVIPGCTEELIPMLHSLQAPPLQTILLKFLNKIRATPSQIVLILDDYHFIDSPQIDQSLTFFLEHLSPNLHLILSSRCDPALPLARMRAQGYLYEMRSQDLRFSKEEIEAFCEEVVHMPLSEKDLALLEAKTEGWIAGIQLTTLSLRGQEQISLFLTTLSGKHRFIQDYLFEEVFAHQSSEVQHFLLSTCILDNLSASLCDALLERNDSRQMLQQLEQANLFLVPLDNERLWYRYHHLFVDALRSQPAEITQIPRQTLHRRAAQWYQQQGRTEEAIQHALSAQDFEKASLLIEQVMLMVFERNERLLPLKWLEAFPEEMLQKFPLLDLFYTVLLHFNGRIAETSARIHDKGVKVLANDQWERPLWARMAILQALLYLNTDRSLAIRLLEQALIDLPSSYFRWRGLAMHTLGIVYQISGQSEKALTLLQETLDTNQSPEQKNLVISTLYMHAILLQNQGTLHKALSVFQEVIDRAGAAANPHMTFIIGGAYILIGSLYYEFNQLDQAEKSIMQGTKYCSEDEESGSYLYIAYFQMMKLKMAQKKKDEAESFYYKAKSLATKYDLLSKTQNSEKLEAIHAEIWLVYGDNQPAQYWEKHYRHLTLKDDEIDRNSSNSTSLMQTKLVQLRVLNYLLIVQNKPVEALERLPSLEIWLQAGMGDGVLIEVFALQALAYYAQGDLLQAIESLKRAIEQAEPEGYIRTFVDLGTPMKNLLSAALTFAEKQPEIKISTIYLKTLLKAFPQTSSEPFTTALSAREMEVLHLLEAGLSNQEIAKHLIVSLSTIKTHLQRIYTKLDATNRTQALKKARAFHLL